MRQRSIANAAGIGAWFMVSPKESPSLSAREPMTGGAKFYLDAQILNEYASMRSRTLDAWSANAGTVAAMEIPYHPTKLALSVGCNFSLPPEVERLHGEVAEIDDRAVQLVAKEHCHFTFLACTAHISETIDDLPKETATLISIFNRYASVIDFKLSSLRLVPLPNALLIAGIPDQETQRLRHEFAADVLRSPFGHLIKARYHGYPIHRCLAYDVDALQKPIFARTHSTPLPRSV